MRRVILAGLLLAGCNQILGLDQASQRPVDGSNNGDGSDAAQATCATLGCPDLDQPVCDTGTQTCRACEANSECSSNACIPSDFPVTAVAGSCAVATDVAYIAPSGTANTECSASSPCDIASALATHRLILKFASGTVTGALQLTDGMLVLADDGADLSRAADGPLVSTGGAVSIYDLRIEQATTSLDKMSKGIGVDVFTGTTRLIHVEINDNADLGVSASGDSVVIQRSTIAHNTAGGVNVTTGAFDITNSFVVQNGAAGVSGSLFGGLYLTPNKTDSVLQFNTIADNLISTSTSHAAGADCDFVPSASVSALNNLLVNNGTDEGGSGCDFGGSMQRGASEEASFGFVDPGSYNYHLGSGSGNPAVDAATLTLHYDIDDQSRPFGTAPDMGAHERH